MRRMFSVVIILLVIALSHGPMILGQDLRNNSEPAKQTAELSPQEAALRTAASQSEIIDVLLAEGRYVEAIDEFAVIVNLGLESEHEILVVQAAWDFAVFLREKDQFETAHKIIDQALDFTLGSESRYSLLMMRGMTFKDQGRYDLAIQALREAKRLSVQIGAQEEISRTRVPQ